MVVILDELTPLEFFSHGGIVKLNIKNDVLINECNVKKKYTFFEHKEYIRFFTNLYVTYLHLHSDLNNRDVYKFVNESIELTPSIGTSEYVVDLPYDRVVSYETARFYYLQDKKEIEVSPRDPYGIKNVCFSLIDDTDSRWEEYTKQRLERGFDASETWSLDGTIARFISPRLEVFIEDVKELKCHPFDMEFDEWLDILTRMSNGFNLMASDDEKSEEEDKIIDEALELFAKHFHALWT